jgi:HK97 gp10 family phage protein
MSVEVIGLKEANRALKRLPDVVKDKVQHVEDVTAFHVARDAALLAPRSATGERGNPPGFLRSQIKWESRPRSLSAVVGIGFAAFYWKFLEYGTRFVTARPFMRPSADVNRADHQRRMLEALGKSANQIAREAT